MRLRPGSSRDVSTFARLSNAHSQWLRGEDAWQEDELAAILISATGEPADNDRYLEVGGETIAAVHVHMSEPFAKGTITLALPPVQTSRRARPHSHRAPPSASSAAAATAVPHAALQIDVHREDTELVAVAEELGFRVIQKMTTLEGDILDAPAPLWPSDVEVEDLQRDARPGGRLRGHQGGVRPQAGRLAPRAGRLRVQRPERPHCAARALGHRPRRRRPRRHRLELLGHHPLAHRVDRVVRRRASADATRPSDTHCFSSRSIASGAVVGRMLDWRRSSAWTSMTTTTRCTPMSVCGRSSTTSCWPRARCRGPEHWCWEGVRRFRSVGMTTGYSHGIGSMPAADLG